MPSAVPTTVPSAVPSAAPSIAPSAHSTHQPTISPTGFKPTPTPTLTPTASPTSQFTEVLITAQATLAPFSEAQFDSSAQTAFIASVASVLPGVVASDITISNTAAVAAAVAVGGGVGRGEVSIAGAAGINVDWVLSVVMQDLGFSTADDLYNSISASLDAAVANGDLQSALEAGNAVFVGVQVAAATEGYESQQYPDDGGKKKNQHLAVGLGVGLGVGVPLLVAVAVGMYCVMRGEATNVNAPASVPTDERAMEMV
jgi:hypothetical protein